MLQLLQATNITDKLKEQGFDVVNIEAIVNLTSNMPLEIENESSVNVGAIVGGVLGSILVVMVVIVVIILLIIMVRKNKDTRSVLKYSHSQTYCCGQAGLTV